MRTLARLIVNKTIAWAIVITVLIVAAIAPVMASRLENDDNLLAFLPQTNPDVKTFYDVNRRFGGLDVALIGIVTDDPLDAEFLTRLKALTKQLNDDTPGVDYVLSLTSVEDFAPDPKGGVGVNYLIGDVPKTPAEKQSLRDKVMSRDQVVGNLISPDGKAALVYAFVAAGTDPKSVANAIRKRVDEAFPREAKYWGGGPFIQSYIYSTTEKDIRKLTPYACIAIILIAIASFRDAVGSMLALFSTGVGIVVALAIMAALGLKANLVLGSLPVILFALGSAYPIHILTRYYTIADEMGCEGALTHTLTNLGPTVIATGLVTVSGLLSFMAMDMKPMQTFGLFTGIGVFVTLVLAVTFVPAVIRVVNLKGKRSIERPSGKLMVKFCTMAQTHRIAVGAVLGVVAVSGAFLMRRLDTRIDNSAFFSKDSPPAAAEQFLREHFGGSQFVQLHVEGDMTDPAVLREVRSLGDRLAVLPHVTSVNHVGNIIAMMNDAMDGDERIPDSGARVRLLYGFLEGKKAVRQLVTADRQHALIHAKVDSDRAPELEALLTSVQEIAEKHSLTSFTAVPVGGAPSPRSAEANAKDHELVLLRLRALGVQYGVPLSDAQAEAAGKQLDQRGAAAETEPVKAAILAHLRSEEFTGDLPATPSDAAERVATELAALGSRVSSPDAMAGAIAKALDKPVGDAAAADLASSLSKTVDAIVKRKAAVAGAKQMIDAAKLAVPAGPKGQRFTQAIGNALLDLDSASIALSSPAGTAGAGKMSVQVTGLPVMNRGLSDSVRHNQVESFVVAMSLVFLITLALYRSLWTALLALTPMTLTLLVIYGAMGLVGVRLDIGTSMLASLSIGAGVDYAVHLLAAWKAPENGTLKDAAAYSSFLVGRAIWTNAIMVAAGFVVLTLGEARPLQNVGGLTAAAMLVAGAATFAAIPVFARKLKYDARDRIASVTPPSDVGEAVVGTTVT